jgi:hypothetical protein
MRGMGYARSVKGPDPRGLVRCVPLVWLLVVAACGSELQNHRGVTQSAVLTVSGGPVFDFGPVTVSTAVDREFSITNIGSMKASELTASFYLSSNFSFAGGSFPGEGGDCGSELLPRETCAIVVRFTPSSTGTLEAFLPVSYFDGNGPRTNADLLIRGKGMAPPEP